jgi:hypothetical protein
VGSQPPCGGAAKGSNRPFRDLTLGKFTATYAKLFKTLVFAATRPKQRAIPVQTGVVPVFPSSAHSEPILQNFCNAAKGCFPKEANAEAALENI